MAKKSDFEGWLIGAVAVGLGLAFLYYARTGLEKENDAALIPNNLEDQIDALISALNKRFGKPWVELGLGVLERYVQARCRRLWWFWCVSCRRWKTSRSVAS